MESTFNFCSKINSQEKKNQKNESDRNYEICYFLMTSVYYSSMVKK